ncbi:hypothetical protein AXF42_Ash006467 [Apostasia shenzhenica]|uniref:C2 domain-containing protein n=1 Tax=Apostasia shenzhenica TaxID=1088818 RepID=A0A2I0AZ53_9ASPA|nr:hypothetical protein AXF42_Ash006467 [Apostasia shenzhenica]
MILIPNEKIQREKIPPFSVLSIHTLSCTYFYPHTLRHPSPTAAAAAMVEEKGKPELEMVVTVHSAESLKLPSLPILPRRRFRPYASLSTFRAAGGRHRTRVDEKGACNPVWEDTVSLPIDAAFLRPRRRRRIGGWEEEEDDGASVNVRVMSKGWLMGPTELGWCRILPGDVVDGLRPPAMPRRLSYALRTGRHGGRGQGVIHMTVRLMGAPIDCLASQAAVVRTPAIAVPPAAAKAAVWGQVAIGIPVAAVAVDGLSPAGINGSCSRLGGHADGGHVAC